MTILARIILISTIHSHHHKIYGTLLINDKTKNLFTLHKCSNQINRILTMIMEKELVSSHKKAKRKETIPSCVHKIQIVTWNHQTYLINHHKICLVDYQRTWHIQESHHLREIIIK